LKPSFLLLAALAIAMLPAIADNKALISGPGANLTNAKCALCHDNEHISRSKLSRVEWEDNLKNMISRGMPPLTESETSTILAYLSTYYGPNPPPAPSPDTLATGGDDPVAKLLNANACLGCHAIDKRLVGPGFREIAAKYASDAGAAKHLAARIKAGGKGNWGPIPMPGNSALTDAELASLAGWVLQQR
jgi:cytochrome c